MRWSRILLFVFVVAAAYVAWPMYSVLQIREAVKAGDTATLARKVEWDSVRTTLKASMSAEAIAALETDPNAPKPTLWQRVKSKIAPHVAKPAIDRYVTPEYFPVFMGYRRIWRGATQPIIGPTEPPTQLAGTWLGGTAIDRFVAFYGRVRRAVFQSFTRFEIEVVDRYRADRSFTGTLELRDFEWKLIGLTISKPTVSASAAGSQS
jgi:Protein of unknown function (DUF2939)